MGKITFYIVSLGLIWLIICAAWPYWNKFKINSDLEAAAIYGTKHSTEDTQDFFRQKLKDRGYDFNEKDFHIEKNEQNTVSIKWTYEDKIRFLGMVLKRLEFTLEVTERESKAFL